MSTRDTHQKKQAPANVCPNCMRPMKFVKSSDGAVGAIALPWMARDHIPKKIAVLPKGGDTRGAALHRAASKRLRSDEPALSAMLSQNCDLPTAAMPIAAADLSTVTDEVGSAMVIFALSKYL
jgi:hypothetical protein